MPLFPFAQFELAGRFPLADGRYLARNAEGDDDDVLVITSLQAPRRERRRRSRRARHAGEQGGAESLPAARATIVRASAAFSDDEKAREWLAGMRRDPEARDAFTTAARTLLNAALHVHRAAAMDPYVAELGPQAASATRIGFGDGDELSAGRWSEAVDAPPDPGRRRGRGEVLRPQERLAAVLADRDRVDACETLVLRARLDLDQGRTREAALQLEPGLRAMLAEVPPASGGEQADDLKLLQSRLRQISHAAEEALSGDLPIALEAVVAETLAVAERVLRRRRLLGDSA